MLENILLPIIAIVQGARPSAAMSVVLSRVPPRCSEILADRAGEQHVSLRLSRGGAARTLEEQTNFTEFEGGWFPREKGTPG
eukprot:1991356-Pyramimonas_sp.AAC.1